MSSFYIDFLGEVERNRVQTFLPDELTPQIPSFLVWFTGTLGQAEWLISHSKMLRGRSIPLSCPKTIDDKNAFLEWRDLPEKIKPLMRLEQPDLIVSDSSGNPLFSIEITEQQPIGLNAQQRMGRFWSAVANGIPSAYLLPIESYQLERANAGVVKAANEVDTKMRQASLLASQIPIVTKNMLIEKNIDSVEVLNSALEKGLLPLAQSEELELTSYLKKHILSTSDFFHIKEVSVEEFVHKVGNNYQKAYIRRAGIPGSMLIKWFEKCNKLTSTAAFQLPIAYKHLFRANGRVHTLNDESNPHLSFRNLPPGPGVSPALDKKRGKDEISQFFEMLDNEIGNKAHLDLGRSALTEPNEFFPDGIESTWQKRVTDHAEIFELSSGDFRIERKLFSDLVISLGIENLPGIQSFVQSYKEFNLYKIYCSAPQRALSDPYTGALALRDVLFTRPNNLDKRGSLFTFDRNSALIFWVDMRGEAAKKHSFLEDKVSGIHKKHFGLKSNYDTQTKIIEIIEKLSAEQIPKDLRAHLLFSDLILVRRILPGKILTQSYFGLPQLLKMGHLNEKCTFLESLRI